jgi:RluA family pseudouridine synthase
MIFSSTVPSVFRKAVPLIDYLAGRFTYHGGDAWRTVIRGGKISCNGSVAHEDDTVSAGDTVLYDAGEFEEPAADLSYRICYEDEWLLGIDKPGNLLVHRAGRSFRNNLIYQLRYVHVPPYPMAHAVHRLDRETSGVVCVAKTAGIKAVLGREFTEGKVKKVYYAVVRGAPEVREIDFPIGKTADSAIPYKHGIDPGGKAAVTRVIETRSVGRNHTLVTLQPLTGRTHQIRIHLAAIGTPIVGDRLYGLSEEAYLARRGSPSKPRQDRQALHCASLSFIHPCTKQSCRIEAEIPDDMSELIRRLSEETHDSD